MDVVLWMSPLLQQLVLLCWATVQPFVSVPSPLHTLDEAEMLGPRCLFLLSSSHLDLLALIMSSMGPSFGFNLTRVWGEEGGERLTNN